MAADNPGLNARRLVLESEEKVARSKGDGLHILVSIQISEAVVKCFSRKLRRAQTRSKLSRDDNEAELIAVDIYLLTNARSISRPPPPPPLPAESRIPEPIR